MYSQLTLGFKKQEFLKIGNKVFIPTGVQTYFQRLKRLTYISSTMVARKQTLRLAHKTFKNNDFAKNSLSRNHDMQFNGVTEPLVRSFAMEHSLWHIPIFWPSWSQTCLVHHWCYSEKVPCWTMPQRWSIQLWLSRCPHKRQLISQRNYPISQVRQGEGGAPLRIWVFWINEKMLNKLWRKYRPKGHIFFRPSPSWLSPGRNTVSCQLNELCSNLHRPLFGSIKKEHGPIHSPNICPCTMAIPRKQRKTQEQAKNTKTKQTNQKPNKQKPASSQRTSSSKRIGSSLCANTDPKAITAVPWGLTRTPRFEHSCS